MGMAKPMKIDGSTDASAKMRLSRYSRTSGYTLIEAAVVILIVGIAIGSFFAIYTIHVENKKMIQTETSLSQLTAAIGNFRAQYGRYPCPASLTAPVDNPQYGREAIGGCADEAQVAIGTCNMGDPAVGYCVERSARQIDTDNVPGPDTFPRVRRGAIPFKNLNIPEEYTYDGHGNRIVYAVTERLAVTATFQLDHGGIGIVDDATPPGSVLFAPDVAHFLVLSPGENGAGAYSKNGVQIQACPNPATNVEGENCNTQNNRARYVLTGLRNTNGNARYDDRMAYFSQAEFSLWQRTAADRNNIEQRPGGTAGIGAEPASGVPYVSGTMRTADRVFADQLCNDDVNPASTKCFQANKIGGAGMNCPANQYVTAINDGNVDCKPNIQAGCDDEFLVGVNPDGSQDCRKIVTCPAGIHTFCGGISDTLPVGIAGDVVVGPTTGMNFTCNVPNWVPAAMLPACCVAGTTTATVSCGPGFALGGTKTITTTTVCPSGAQSTTTDTSGCVCLGGSVTTTISCAYGPSITKTVTTSCPSGAQTTTTSGTCPPPPGAKCTWKPVNQIGTVNATSMPKPAAGAGCQCGRRNRACFTVGLPGVSYNKHNCRCSKI